MSYCEICESEAETDLIQVSPGRDHGGVGGPARPPEMAHVCQECQDKKSE